MQKIPLILTRTEDANSAFCAEFPKALAAQLSFVFSPLLRIEPIAPDVALPGDAVAIFTSVNGVRFTPHMIGQKAYCVGLRTTKSAVAAGWDAVCAGQNAEELIAELRQVRPRAPLFHMSGVHVRGDIAQTLTAAGLTTERIAVYDQHLLHLSDDAYTLLAGQNPVIAPLFSPRVAAHFVSLAPASSTLRVVTMSEAVTDAMGNFQCNRVVTAREPTADAMISLIEKQVADIGLG